MTDPGPETENLRIRVSGEGDVSVVEVVGEVDVATSRLFREQLVAVVESGARDIVVDMRGLEFLDSIGLADLVVAFKRLRSRGGTLALRAPRPPTRQVLAISGLDRLLPIVD